MEVNEDIHDPESNFDCLVHQVEEQSEFCDVTVTVGDWRKRFHRCVLTASLLFRSIINTQIADAQTGNVDEKSDRIQDIPFEIKIDTSPNVAEMAIMFMYGINPDFTIDNIGDFLELEEYLQMEDLKQACVEWFDSLDYSEINVIYAIQLSKKYNFEIPTCMEYIESHFPETLLLNEAIDLPEGLVSSLFTDERFSYVQMDDKLNFLVRLTNKYPTEAMEDFIIKLFGTIDLTEVTAFALESAKNDAKFNLIFDLENVIRQIQHERPRQHVMIMSSDENYFVCLDLQNRINSRFYERCYYEDFTGEIAGIRNNNPEVYFKLKDDYDEESDCIFTVDLNSDELNEYNIQLSLEYLLNEDIVDVGMRQIVLNNDTVVAVGKISIQMYLHSSSSDSEAEIVCSHSEEETDNDMNSARLVHVAPEISSDSTAHENSFSIYTPWLSSSGERSSSTSSSSSGVSPISDSVQNGMIHYTIVSVGDTSSHDVVLRPLFSLQKENITQICINNHGVLALLSKSSKEIHVILYDIVECTIHRPLSVKKGNYVICSTDSGFLLHNHTHCYCLTKVTTPTFSGSYKVEGFMLETREDWFAKYHFQNGVWIRILRRNLHNDIELQYILHEELIDQHSSIDVNWRNVSMPKDKKLFEKVMDLKSTFIVPLSKRKLRCHIECPHCKFSDEAELFY